MKYAKIKVDEGKGSFRGVVDGDVNFTASFDLFLIHAAWGMPDDVGGTCEYEDLADGYGPGEGTHGDWSGIRDSSREAKDAMFERALNHFFK